MIYLSPDTRHGRMVRCMLLMIVTAVLAGCDQGKLQTKIVFGRVTCDGEVAEAGWIRFYPIRDTKGPATKTIVIGGEYRIEARGGLPVGWHRVEVELHRNTGRQVRDPQVVGGMTDELAPITPDEYAGVDSPLEIEVVADSDGRLDFDLPRRK